MLIALHKCECGDPHCDSRGLIGFGQTMDELKDSIGKHWEMVQAEDPSFATFEIYTHSGSLTLQREVTLSEVKAN